MKKIILFLIVFSIQLTFAQQLTETQKLATTCKVWGFLKYYHPNVASGKFNWDEQLFAILPKVEQANTKDEFSKVLENWIDSLGELKKIAPIKDSDTTKYFYKNLDLAWLKKTTLFSKKVCDKLEFIRDNRWQGESFYIYVDKKEGFSSVQIQNEPRNYELKWNDKNLQLITLFRYWNIINYFYPYKYLMDEDWDTVLLESIPKFKNFETETDFHWQINLLVAKLNDSHGSFFSNLIAPKIRGKYNFFASLKIIDNKLIVNKINNDSLAIKEDVKVGDVITKIDNETILEIINKNKNNFSYSNNSTLLRTINFIASFGNNETFEAEYERNGIKTIC